MNGDFRAGAWLVQPKLNQIAGNGGETRVEPKVMQVLVCLAERAGEVVLKDELLRAVWPDTFVTEDVLTRSISELRRIFRDDPRDPRFIQTIPKSGYRFIAPVEGPSEESAASTEPVSAPAPTASTVKPQRPDEPPRFFSRRRLSLAVVGASVVVLLTGFVYLRAWRSVPVDSLAVLPLANAGGKEEMDYLSDGLTESLIHSLSQVHDLKVKPRSSVIRFRGREAEAAAVGRELGVAVVLAGEIVERDPDLVVNVELINACDDTHVWSGQYIHRPEDLTAFQAEIATDVSRELRLRISGGDQARLVKRYTANPEAYRAYLRGRFFWNQRSEEGFKKGIEYFRRAVEIDPNYALAFAGLADSYALLADYDFMPHAEALPQAKAAALRALELDSSLAEAHTALAGILCTLGENPQEAERGLRRAIALNPNYATAHHWLANVLVDAGRLEEALAEATRARELEPNSYIITRWRGEILFMLRRYPEAINDLREAVNLSPEHHEAHFSLGQAYEKAGMGAEAVNEYLKGLRVEGESEERLTSLEAAFERGGIEGYWRRVLEFRMRPSHSGKGEDYLLASIHSRLGEKDQAFRYLQKVVARDPEKRAYLATDPMLDSLRSDPRFGELMSAEGQTAGGI